MGIRVPTVNKNSIVAVVSIKSRKLRRWLMKDVVSAERRDTSQESAQQEGVGAVITSAGIADRRVTWLLTAQSLKSAADAARKVM